MKAVNDFLKAYKGLIFLVVLALVGLNGCSSYNTMAKMNVDVDAKWSQVENVYQRRSDLIPALVETVKGYAKHEKGTLTDVISARAKATSINIDASKLDANTLQKFEQAQGGLTHSTQERSSRLIKEPTKHQNLSSNIGGLSPFFPYISIYKSN